MYMEVGSHRGLIVNEHISLSSNSYEKAKTFKYLGSLLTNILLKRKLNNIGLKQEIHVITQYKHFSLLDFSLRI